MEDPLRLHASPPPFSARGACSVPSFHPRQLGERVAGQVGGGGPGKPRAGLSRLCESAVDERHLCSDGFEGTLPIKRPGLDA
jgi:hypothetical protein